MNNFLGKSAGRCEQLDPPTELVALLCHCRFSNITQLVFLRLHHRGCIFGKYKPVPAFSPENSKALLKKSRQKILIMSWEKSFWKSQLENFGKFWDFWKFYKGPPFITDPKMFVFSKNDENFQNFQVEIPKSIFLNSELIFLDGIFFKVL